MVIKLGLLVLILFFSFLFFFPKEVLLLHFLLLLTMISLQIYLIYLSLLCAFYFVRGSSPIWFDLIKFKLAYVIVIVIVINDDDDENRVGTVYTGGIHTWEAVCFCSGFIWFYFMLLLLAVGLLCFAGVLRNDDTASDLLRWRLSLCHDDDQSWFRVYLGRDVGPMENDFSVF